MPRVESEFVEDAGSDVYFVSPQGISASTQQSSLSNLLDSPAKSVCLAFSLALDSMMLSMLSRRM